MTGIDTTAARPAATRWADWSLATQFAVAGGLVLLMAMVIVGSWVAARIKDGVVRNTANATAQYMESFISPLSQDLAKSDTLSPGAKRALDEIFNNTPLGERVVSYKIWKSGGLVVEASDPALVGQRFEVDDDLRAAWTGRVSASFGPLSDPENLNEQALGVPLLEIYSPIREVWSGNIIGVVEFYEVASELNAELAAARRNSWAAVALVMLLLGSSLYAIVLRGSRTIDRQREALTRQLATLSDLSDHNTALRLRVQNAAARTSAMNDQSLRQIGADLHDGPAQLMGFAALRLDDLRPALSSAAAVADLGAVERAVKDAIREIRSISRGLSLPDIQTRSACDVVRSVAEAHAARTGTEVAVACTVPDAETLAPAIKICLYRFVQEGLNNAWRHAGGVGQRVDLTLAGTILTLVVSDRGPGFPDKPDLDPADCGMGLAGLRDRVESLGGSFAKGANRSPRVASEDPQGAEIRMVIDVKDAQ